VDNDPIVLSHARALLISTPQGACTYIEADVRDPEPILADSRLLATLDLAKPVALTLFGIMHFIPDENGPYEIVSRLLGALPSGSYLAIQHPTADFYPSGVGGQAAYRKAGIAFQYRTQDEFARFLDMLELIEPGITPMADWRPEIEPGPALSPVQAGAYAALARKP
jgi:S-adenosyl methyltransferase